MLLYSNLCKTLYICIEVSKLNFLGDSFSSEEYSGTIFFNLNSTLSLLDN